MNQLSAALLVGGLGTRLRAVVDDRNKVVADINGKPFVTYLLDQLANAGTSHVVLCTGYHGDLVENLLGTHYGNIELEYSRETEPLGTGGALANARPLLRSDPVLVMNGDSYCQVDLGQFRSFFQAKQAEAALVLVKVADAGRFGSVRCDPDDRIVSFEEKDAARTAGAEGWINAGIYLIGQAWLGKISARRPLSLERDVFPTWTGREFYGFRGTGRFIDIGTPEAYAAAGSFFTEPGQGDHDH